MKAVVRDDHWYLTTEYVNVSLSNGRVVKVYISGLEYILLKVVLKRMNMALFHVPKPKEFEIRGKVEINNLILHMFGKEIYIAVGGLGTNFWLVSIFDSTNPYYTITARWYVPCSEKYPRWSSIFRILSVELWLVLILSIVFVAISITLVGRYNCTTEWQGYKNMTSSLINVWAVILGVSVSTMPRTPSLRSLFLALVCFSLSLSTVFQAFLTTFLIDSGFKTPIKNMDELFGSGIKLAYEEVYNLIFDIGNEKEGSKVKRNRVNCPSFLVCVDWAVYQKNVSILMYDNFAEIVYESGYFVGKNSEHLVCRLEDGVVTKNDLSMIMFHGDPLMKRVTEIIDRVVEAGIYNYWISIYTNQFKLYSHRIAIVNPLDGYYSFELYHLQPAFYLLLMGWCISVICFMVELLCNRVISKRK
jgi:hypothetical protein